MHQKAGGIAGLSADVILFPLDTIKTRLQSEQGFRKSGGFSKVYSGLASAAIGSVPSAAVFFLVYESGKKLLPDSQLSVSVSASVGEAVACGIRVPVEVVKQRAQSAAGHSSLQHLKLTIGSEGVRGLYRGYSVMLIREIPFSFIQFPIWESLKSQVSRRTGRQCDGREAMACGVVAGGVSAFLTNPLDVSKTRVMLAQKGSRMSGGSVVYALRAIYRESGPRGLFAGALPRVAWISIGGALFLGGYEKAAQLLQSLAD